MALAACIQGRAQSCLTPTLADAQLCTGNTFNYTSALPLALYDEQMNLLSVSTSLNLSPTTSTSYKYAATEYVGPADNSFGTGAFYTTVDKYISFSLAKNMIINTVDVYTAGPGNITLKICETNVIGMITSTLVQKTLSVPSSGLHTLPLGIAVPQGSRYKMILVSESCGGLFRNESGNAFNYQSTSGHITLTGSDYDFMGYYYYFYNWNVSDPDCVNTLQIQVSNPHTSSVSETVPGTLSASISGASYQWINCQDNSPIAGQTGPNFTPTANGSYAVTIAQNGCSSTSDCYLFSSVSITENEAAQVRVYPNPFQDYLHLELGDTPRKVSIRVISIAGQEVKNYTFGAYTSGTLDLAELPSGMYILKLILDTDETRTLRILKP